MSRNRIRHFSAASIYHQRLAGHTGIGLSERARSQHVQGPACFPQKSSREISTLPERMNPMERIAVPARKTASPFLVFLFDCGETFQDALLFFRVDSGKKAGNPEFLLLDHSFPFLSPNTGGHLHFPVSFLHHVRSTFFSSECTLIADFSLEIQHTFYHHCSILTLRKSIHDTYQNLPRSAFSGCMAANTPQ